MRAKERSTNRTLLTVLLLTTAAFLVGCATSPHGQLYAAVIPAPDMATGEGCDKFGVERSSGLTMVATNPVFNPQFISTSEVTEYCPTSGKQAVWGCYHPNGDAYIVGKDWKVYWHEWCHAKLGPGHKATRDAQSVFLMKEAHLTRI